LTNFNIEQSVKQGDALSCALFILSIEPLLRQIRNNKKVQGIKISHLADEVIADHADDEINNFSFADDITAICENREGIQEIVNCYSKFSEYSGIKLNLPKTEILVIGKKGNEKENFTITSNQETITITDQVSVKICGITFSNNDNLAYKENIENKILKLEKQLTLWRQRNLTLKGKILIVKTFGLSQLIYSMQSTRINEPELKRIEDIIYKFIWNLNPSGNNTNGKIKRDVLQQDYIDGGLKAPNIRHINTALKIRYLLRNHSNPHPIGIISTSNNSTSAFIRDSQNSLESFKNIIVKDLEKLTKANSKINKMYGAYFFNQEIKECSYFNINQQCMIQKLRKFNIVTLGDITKEKINASKPKIIFEIHQLYHSLPPILRKTLLTYNYCKKIDTKHMFPYKLNIWKHYDSIKSKDIRLRLSENKTCSATEILTKRHDVNVLDGLLSNPFSSIRALATTKLQGIQYKLLHNIYPTMKHLKIWGIKNNDKCETCGVIDDLKHTIFDCYHAKGTLKNFLTLLRNKYNINIDNLKYNTLLFGFGSTNRAVYKNCEAIDTIIILIKQMMILQRNDKYVITEMQIDNLINSQKCLEEKIITKKIFNRKWSNFASPV
jgi:hypothetical protein